MQGAPYRLIPITDRHGTVIGHAKVDPADYESLSHWRWRRGGLAGAYVCRYYKGSDGKTRGVLMHRALLGLTDPRVYVDHINRDPRDNRRANLRLATNSLNQQNQKWNPKNRSGYRNVGWDSQSGKWRVQVRLNGKQYQLGLFSDPAEGGRVAAEFRAKHMPYSPYR